MKFTFVMLFTLCASYSFAALEPMTEATMSGTYGQAIFEVRDQAVEQADGSSLNMLRLTMGAHVEINANIEELSLGRYWRPEGTNCTGGAGGDKVCYNNIVPESYNDNIDWACTAKPCGSIGLDSANYLSSDLTHDIGEESFFNESIFPAGFEPDSGVDVKLRHLTMGQVRDDDGDGVFELIPLVQENPYFEFAFDESSGARKLVGFRLGFEDSFGYQGNAIDVISGFVRPSITVDAKLFGAINVGQIFLETQLGGVRTIGWIDANTTFLKGTTGLTGLLIGSEEDLEGQSPHAQLYPVQSNYLNHSPAFFFSAGTRSITWSEVGGFTPAASQPGFWLNLGGDGALVAETQKGSHPVNYYPGHSYGNAYYTAGSAAKIQNYNNAQPSWSETYQ